MRGQRGAAGCPAPTCRGPVSFPAGTARAGCLLAHPTCCCTPAGSTQEPRESGARGCGQAGTCAPLPAPCCTPGPVSQAPPSRDWEVQGARGVGLGFGVLAGGAGTAALTCPFSPAVPAGGGGGTAGAHARHAAGATPAGRGIGAGPPPPVPPTPQFSGGLSLQPGAGG